MRALLLLALAAPGAQGVGYCNDKVHSCAAWAKDGECSGKRNTTNKRRLAKKEKDKAEKEAEKRQQLH